MPENYSTQELMIIAAAREINDYENVSNAYNDVGVDEAPPGAAVHEDA